MWLRLLFDGQFVANSHIFFFLTYILCFIFREIYNILCNISSKLFFSFFVAIYKTHWRFAAGAHYGVALSAGKEVVDRILR